MKIFCGGCKKEMTDYGTYIQCNSGLCSPTVSTHAIPITRDNILKYQLSGTIVLEENKGHLSQEDIDFNEGPATWKGVMLRDMTRLELYKAFNALGSLYQETLNQKRKDL